MSTNEQEIMTELENELGLPREDDANGFDIATEQEQASKEDEGTVVHINGVDDKPRYFIRDGKRLPVTITVAGSNSRLFRKVEAELRKRKLKAKNLTSEALYDDNIEKVARCTLDWDGFLNKGAPVRCDVQNARMLYKTCPWVLNQLIEAMNEHERFFVNGSQTR